jgi:hypothetical protein
MKTKEMKKQEAFEKDYHKIMKDFQKQDAPFANQPQWINPGDFIVKFSLYQDSPNSITSTNTSPIL